MDNNDFQREGTSANWRPTSKKTGVRRVNNMPLIIVGGVLVVFVILVAWVAFDRSQRLKQQKTDSQQSVVSVDQGLADSVLKASGNRAGGLVDDNTPSTPSLPIAKVSNLDLPPPPPASLQATSQQPPEDPVAVQLKAAKLAMLQKAIQAPTKVDEAVSKSAGDQTAPSNSAQTNARARAKQGDSTSPTSDLDRLKAAGLNVPGLSGMDAPQASPNSSSSYAKFDRKDEKDRWQLDSSVEAPRTPYELRAGFVIPATLISGINSDLPGQIVAQVSQDVYDTATGKYKLIPQGTRLVGSYDSQVAYGQSRVLVAWQRLVFPDGKAMDIGSMPGVDGGGYTGFNDKVNNHYLRLFGSALLMSGIVAGINSSQTSPNNDPFGTSTNTLLSQAIAQQMGQVAVELFKKNLNIAPTLEIRPGYRFNVMVVKDLTFVRPYQAFDY
jgi:type IV secretion system protein VirB10